jgi:hypothetical protein
MPSHRHSSNGIRAGDGSSGKVAMRSATFSNEYDESVSYTEYAGGDESHNNM